MRLGRAHTVWVKVPLRLSFVKSKPLTTLVELSPLLEQVTRVHEHTEEMVSEVHPLEVNSRGESLGNKTSCFNRRRVRASSVRLGALRANAMV